MDLALCMGMTKQATTKAIVTRLSDGIATVKIKRTGETELYGRHADLKVGDRIEVKRIPNNPYIVRVVIPAER